MLNLRPHSGAELLAFLSSLLLMMGSIGAAAAHLLFAGRSMTSQWLDREIAFRAAEVALLDAEADLIAAIVDVGGWRLASCPTPGTCGTGAQRGLCMADGDMTAWMPWLEGNLPADLGIETGTFTRITMPILPADVIGATTAPRYVIEPLDDRTGLTADAWPRFRITALGFGRDTGVRALLQTEFQP